MGEETTQRLMSTDFEIPTSWLKQRRVIVGKSTGLIPLLSCHITGRTVG